MFSNHMEKDLTISIVNWNAKEFLDKFIESIYENLVRSGLRDFRI